VQVLVREPRGKLGVVQETQNDFNSSLSVINVSENLAFYRQCKKHEVERFQLAPNT